MLAVVGMSQYSATPTPTPSPSFCPNVAPTQPGCGLFPPTSTFPSTFTLTPTPTSFPPAGFPITPSFPVLQPQLESRKRRFECSPEGWDTPVQDNTLQAQLLPKRRRQEPLPSSLLYPSPFEPNNVPTQPVPPVQTLSPALATHTPGAPPAQPVASLPTPASPKDNFFMRKRKAAEVFPHQPWPTEEHEDTACVSNNAVFIPVLHKKQVMHMRSLLGDEEARRCLYDLPPEFPYAPSKEDLSRALVLYQPLSMPPQLLPVKERKTDLCDMLD